MTLYLPFWKTTIKKENNAPLRNGEIFISKTCKPFTIKAFAQFNSLSEQWRYEIRVFKRKKTDEKEKEVSSFSIIVCNNPNKVERFVNTAIENFSNSHEPEFKNYLKMNRARESAHNRDYFEPESGNLYFNLPFCPLPFKLNSVGKFNFKAQDIVEVLPSCIGKIINSERVKEHSFNKKVYGLIVGRRSDEHSALYTISTIKGKWYSVREYWVTRVEQTEEKAFKKAHNEKFDCLKPTKPVREVRPLSELTAGSVIASPEQYDNSIATERSASGLVLDDGAVREMDEDEPNEEEAETERPETRAE